MKTYNVFNNERGGMAALLSVIVLSMIMVSTLTSFYIYLENRAKMHERLRMNYQTGYVMEDMSRAILEARELYIAGMNQPSPPPNPCPGTMQVRFLDCTQICATPKSTYQATGTVPADAPAYAVCVKTDNLNKIVNGADYFCAYNADSSSGATQPTYCATIGDNYNSADDGATIVAHNKTDSKLHNWYGRLDKFFDATIVQNVPKVAGQMYPILQTQIQPPTLLGWIFPEKAYACTTPDCQTGGGIIDCSAYPNAIECSGKNLKATISLIQPACTLTSTDPRCKKCRRAERIPSTFTSPTCMKVSICPPWVPARECVTQGTLGHDKRIQQMVRIN